jgi:hypothetical protein
LNQQRQKRVDFSDFFRPLARPHNPKYRIQKYLGKPEKLPAFPGGAWP